MGLQVLRREPSQKTCHVWYPGCWKRVSQVPNGLVQIGLKVQWEEVVLTLGTRFEGYHDCLDDEDESDVGYQQRIALGLDCRQLTP